MNIDFYAHVVPPRYLDLVRRDDVPGVRVRRADGGEILEVAGGPQGAQVAQRLPLLAGYHDVAARLAAMDAASVDVHVLSPVQFMFHYWLELERAAALARIANDGITEMVAAKPRRFTGMATLPLQDATAAVAELQRVRALGFRAVEIGTHVAGTPLDSPTSRRSMMRRRRSASLSSSIRMRRSGAIGWTATTCATSWATRWKR
jgi:aminocarboxymuconate-semialdehyde decarboxylase